MPLNVLSPIYVMQQFYQKNKDKSKISQPQSRAKNLRKPMSTPRASST